MKQRESARKSVAITGTAVTGHDAGGRPAGRSRPRADVQDGRAREGGALGGAQAQTAAETGRRGGGPAASRAV